MFSKTPFLSLSTQNHRIQTTGRVSMNPANFDKIIGESIDPLLNTKRVNYNVRWSQLSNVAMRDNYLVDLSSKTMKIIGKRYNRTHIYIQMLLIISICIYVCTLEGRRRTRCFDVYCDVSVRTRTRCQMLINKYISSWKRLKRRMLDKVRTWSITVGVTNADEHHLYCYWCCYQCYMESSTNNTNVLWYAHCRTVCGRSNHHKLYGSVHGWRGPVTMTVDTEVA